MLDLGGYVRWLGEPEADELAACVALCQLRARPTRQLLVEGDLVPRAVRPLDHCGRVQARHPCAVELDRRRVCRQGRPERTLRLDVDGSAESRRSSTEPVPPAMKVVER